MEGDSIQWCNVTAISWINRAAAVEVVQGFGDEVGRREDRLRGEESMLSTRCVVTRHGPGFLWMSTRASLASLAILLERDLVEVVEAIDVLIVVLALLRLPYLAIIDRPDMFIKCQKLPATARRRASQTLPSDGFRTRVEACDVMWAAFVLIIDFESVAASFPSQDRVSPAWLED
ncbi:hypothetical protein CONLIGDRAFT_143477 [Coniochaeta ligniaria NRRL 30616]|uniref:Uncharacterized protein n=1 Tax=Coniochaeta ligniaria NRRL 30616 TaxID=1408157 RepID=A0A1J7IZX7_9PEZI|nr:hypothetical protein CONLIGDRAFT_143477 [Coniochaeta ligniaria NRRL 30616]